MDIDNTDNPIEAGLGFTIAWDKPGGFVGRDALLEFKAQGPPCNRVVSLLVDDPSADLFGNEPVMVDGKWVGYVRTAAYGYTLGGPVGLAQVRHEGGVTGDWLRDQSFTVHTPGGVFAARLQVQPFYDPGRKRIIDNWAQTDRSRRSLATWPVALMLYCATSILPFSSTTKVDLMTP